MNPTTVPKTGPCSPSNPGARVKDEPDHFAPHRTKLAKYGRHRGGFFLEPVAHPKLTSKVLVRRVRLADRFAGPLDGILNRGDRGRDSASVPRGVHEAVQPSKMCSRVGKCFRTVGTDTLASFAKDSTSMMPRPCRRNAASTISCRVCRAAAALRGDSYLRAIDKA